jgi:ribosome-interacting GTPase 1
MAKLKKTEPIPQQEIPTSVAPVEMSPRGKAINDHLERLKRKLKRLRQGLANHLESQ